MAESKVLVLAAADTDNNSSAKREQSTIAFPYADLETAISVARAMLDAGGVPISRDQLAGAMGLAPGSGNFVIKVAAARLFGLIEFTQSRYTLTELGHEILDAGRERAARAAAFLNVPLYRKIYDEFRGKQLPPRPHGLELAIEKFGVVRKQKDKARVAFDKSASQAGFFANGQDRLVEPIIGSPPPLPEPPVQDPASGSGGGGGKPREEVGPQRHPFIEGLLKTLPQPDTVWPEDGRQKWLAAAANIFELIYKKSDDGQGQG